jgi:pantoate kinase
MKHSVKAFAPGNISCIFQIHEDIDPAKMGSMGLGFTINKGVTVDVQEANKTEIFFNGEKIEFSTVRSVVNQLISHPEFISGSSFYQTGKMLKYYEKHYLLRRVAVQHDEFGIAVHISSDLPLGGGFGISGASALATAYAINDLFNLKKTKLDLAKIAHIAEIENKTGLGDVTNQYFGGCLLKTVPSSEFKVHRLAIENIPVIEHRSMR